ncbi:TetR/AcrR family transcriptional regulator [Stenotrophomonas sp. 24(2023)]|uniref:TetR/AcrR family transcriptional regulator n=1 Tax=Stenotrophomonas sp. 24(2023) TaxID=3068324 RepID=UPI0027DF2EC1|nr:TetR/AcrR family transcriptional regulator [Stenotrophomonas sp. 24(2023)]WMJ68396.1 TetR/AcrR family transcriptional regulator [Stenotrophomonas sp. 24(2023)]
MSKPLGRREQKKADTRQHLSNVATLLFIRHGFENVSVADIADAAGVSRKTVFNYFLCKEELMFDREEESRTLLRQALLASPDAPLPTLLALLRRLLEDGHPLLRVSVRARRFWKAVAASPALSAHARQLQITLGDDLAELLLEAAAEPVDPALARLAAAMVMSTLVIGYGQAMAADRRREPPVPAFAAVMERGFAGVTAALAGSPLAARH